MALKRKSVIRVGKLWCVRKNFPVSFLVFLYANSVLQSNPGNSNCQGKLKLLRIMEVSSYRGFEQKDQKHLMKVILCLYMFYCKTLAM